MNFEKITLEVTGLTKTVGQFIHQEASRITSENIKEKGLHDLVTYVDLEAEKRLVAALRIIVPEAGFIAEENQDLQKRERFNWIIDPLDGTTNFIHGVPNFCLALAFSYLD